MKKAYYLLQTYEIFLKLIYFKLLQEYWTYEWDLWNRLVKVVQYNAPDEGECVEVSYEYDALNHRITRTSKGETTKYAYGRNGALAYQEKTVEGNVTKRSFTYLNNEIVGFTDSSNNEETAYYTVTDIQGSITEVYDGSSKLVWKSGYTAFGVIAGETVDLIDFDGMYTGCDYDAETGLTYHWNRWRNEDGSAFISEDPARDGANWYGYAGCNPMVYVDKIGLFASNGFLGPYAADQYNTTPEVGPQPNPNATPQNQTPNITGGGEEQTVIPDVEEDFVCKIWDYIPDILELKDDWKGAVLSAFMTYIDNQLDKAMQKEINGKYKGSLYFQQYITQVEAHNEADGLMTILSFVREPSFSGALTVVGFLHNFEKRDGMLIHENITGFIKGAEQEIVRIDKLLGSSDNQEFKDFLHTQKDYLDKEINLNRNYYFSNIVYQNIYGRQIDIDKNEEIESSVPLPSINYKERFLQGGTN